MDDGRCFVDPGVVDDGSCNCPPSCFTTGVIDGPRQNGPFQNPRFVGIVGDLVRAITEG